MARWYGKVGYGETVETKPGVHKTQIVEREYAGDLTRNIRNLQSSGEVNDDINISNNISIVADPFAYNNFHTIRYVEFMGTKWKVSSVDASQYPRLILTIGGLYNG